MLLLAFLRVLVVEQPIQGRTPRHLRRRVGMVGVKIGKITFNKIELSKMLRWTGVCSSYRDAERILNLDDSMDVAMADGDNSAPSCPGSTGQRFYYRSFLLHFSDSWRRPPWVEEALGLP